MREREIRDLYFHWLCDLVDLPPERNYHLLMCRLKYRSFHSNYPMDDNRAMDGINLRYRFASDCDFDQRIVASVIDIQECSVLEMMVALAIKCDQLITDDNSETPLIFFDMLKSLKLDNMDDVHFNKMYVDNRLNIFLNGHYSKNGSGGLFTLKNIGTDDATQMEIWVQAMWYLNDIIENQNEGAFY